jgi:hypothetical protein
MAVEVACSGSGRGAAGSSRICWLCGVLVDVGRVGADGAERNSRSRLYLFSMVDNVSSIFRSLEAVVDDLRA